MAARTTTITTVEVTTIKNPKAVAAGGQHVYRVEDEGGEGVLVGVDKGTSQMGVGGKALAMRMIIICEVEEDPDKPVGGGGGGGEGNGKTLKGGRGGIVMTLGAARAGRGHERRRRGVAGFGDMRTMMMMWWG